MKLVILDRDGVINEDSEKYIKHPDEWVPIAESLEAIAKLNGAGYQVVIATNQAGIERGLFDMAGLNAIHRKMHEAVKQVGGKIHAIFYCPCLDSPACTCRKPKPGMLLEIAQRFDISPHGIPFVGDSLRDLQAAASASCLPILVLTGNGQLTKDKAEIPFNTLICKDLDHAARTIIYGK